MDRENSSEQTSNENWKKEFIVNYISTHNKVISEKFWKILFEIGFVKESIVHYLLDVFNCTNEYWGKNDMNSSWSFLLIKYELNENRKQRKKIEESKIEFDIETIENDSISKEKMFSGGSLIFVLWWLLQ